MNEIQTFEQDSTASLGTHPEVNEETALKALGYSPVRAWVPDPGAASSATAKRARRSREKAAKAGLKQLSITLPEIYHPLIKELAERTKAGEAAVVVLEALQRLHTTGGKDGDGEVPVLKEGDSCPVRISEWRKMLLRWLIPVSARARFDQVFSLSHARQCGSCSTATAREFVART